ncbi:MAG: DUF6290 family protein [Promethearchaeota archaeon]
MSQINFRINKNDLEIYKEIAESEGHSVAELARKALFNQMKNRRINYAFEKLNQGSCGFKRAFIVSGLSYHEFMLEWAKRDAKEVIPDHIFEKHLKKAIDYDISLLLNLDK